MTPQHLIQVEHLLPASAQTLASLIGLPATLKLVSQWGGRTWSFGKQPRPASPPATDALADIIAGVKAGKKAVISGYTDATGDPAKNAELAKQRALAVRDLLTANGVTEDRIDLQKPADNNAGQGGQARRVDVALQ